MLFDAYGIELVPVIIALVEMAKKLGLPNKWTALLAFILGVVGGFVYISPEDPKKAMLMGVVMGTSASGLYSGVKNTINN